MNIELAERIIANILMEPQQLEMRDWFDIPEGEEDDEGSCLCPDMTIGELRSCGTAACIAGHALYLTEQDNAVIRRGYNLIRADGYDGRIEDAAAAVLELNEDLAMVLFHDTDNDEAVPALKFLIGNPGATGRDLDDFLQEGRKGCGCIAF